jgi:circadian clock protein KaiC
MDGHVGFGVFRGFGFRGDAHTVILFRYFEAHGEVRQAVSVLKKRSGKHERTIRELTLCETGIKIGEPLKAFHGVLTGSPKYDGAAAKRSVE